MNIIYTKDRFTQKRRERKVMELLPYDLGAELIGALEKAFEPLDGLDMPEGDKQRVRETGF